MGFTPEWVNGIMTDNGGGWHQYFIADGIPTEKGGAYMVKALVKANQNVTFNVNMGWGWGGGEQLGTSVTVPASNDFQEVKWQYSGIGGTSCNLVAQPNSSAKIEWKSLTVYKLKLDNDPQKYVINLVPNGDCERDYEEGELPSLTGKSGSGEKAGQMLHTFEDGKGMNGSRAMVIYSTDNTAVDSWNTQFFVTTPNHAWKEGEKYKFKMSAKADYAFSAGTQIHAMPGDYIYWQGVGSYDITSEWKSFEFEGTISKNQEFGDPIGAESRKPQTAAFNLDADKAAKPINTFYFDNIEWWSDGAWTGSANFKDGKPVQAMDNTIAANLEVGDLVKVWVDDETGAYPVMALVDATGDVIAGATYVNENYVKFGVTEKMLPLLQTGGINVKGSDVTMTKVTISENKSVVSFKNACWIGDFVLDGTGSTSVPAYEFSGDVEAGYTIDLRFDGDAVPTDLVLSFGGGNSVSYAKNPELFKVAGKSIKLKISEKELPALQKNGLEISGNVPNVILRVIAVTPTLGTNSFNFLKMKIATSGDGNEGDIIPENLDGANYLEIIDEVDGNGGAGSGAILTITPNLDVDDFPAEVPAVTRFVSTEAGPQLRLSGGYNGMTIKIESANAFNKLAFGQTNFSIKAKADKGIFDNRNGVWTAGEGVTVNDVTFTLQADTTEVWNAGKLQEVVLNDMGLWWIYQIEVDPISDVVIDAADGADLGALVAAEMAKYAKPATLTVNLAAGGNYTTSQTITTGIPTIINGNDAEIDASGLGAAFITLSGSKDFAPMKDGTESDHYQLSSVEIKGVKIAGLSDALITDAQKTLLENLTIDNSVIEMPAAGKNVINFNGKGYVGDVVVKNSTIYAPAANTGFFAQYGSRPKNVNGDLLQKFDVQNSTIVNIANGKNVCDLKQNGTAQNVYVLKNNIFVNTGKNGQTVVGFNKGQTSATPEWDVTGNNFCWGDANVNAAEITKAGQKDGADIVKNCVDGIPAFKDVAAGDFTQTDVKTGDPRWFSGKGAGEATGIETVKNAQEDGTWYTIQGVRVAQPTKGLYIHNGKKVILK